MASSRLSFLPRLISHSKHSMQLDFLDEYQKLRDEFRQAQAGGCASIDRSLNTALYNANWQASKIDGTSPSVATSSSDESPCNSSSSLEESNVSLSPDSRGLAVIASNAVVAGKSVRKHAAAFKLADKATSEIYSDHRPRKGHKKSRGGCFNCKKRKIKVC